METESRFKVRYVETDRMGIVHHSNYPIWFEIGRSDYCKKVGITYAQIEESGVMLPLYDLKCQYKSPAKYGDEILVITGVKMMTKTRIAFVYRVINSLDGKLLAEGETSHAWVNSCMKPINAEKVIPHIYKKFLEHM